MKSPQKKSGRVRKKLKSLKVPVWVQLIEGKPDRLYWENPNKEDFEIFRLTMRNLHGKNFKIVLGSITVNLNKSITNLT